MNANRLLILASFLAVFACKTSDSESGDDPVDPVIEAQIELCEEVCIKPFCSGTLEPAPGVGDECRARCTETVEAAQNDGCTDRYQELLECLEAVSCDDFYLWANMEAGAPCAAEEEELGMSCPAVEVRNDGG